MLGTTLVLGMTLGAVTGGKLMKIGRRRAQFINIFVGLAGAGITMEFNLTTILIGRFLFGFSSGLFSSTVPRYIEETVPTSLYDTLAPMYTFS